MRQERRMANGYGIFSLWMNWIMGVGSLVAVLLLSPHIDKMWLPLVVFMLEFILFTLVRHNREAKLPVCYLIPFICTRVLFWSAVVMVIINVLYINNIVIKIFDVNSINPEIPYISVLIVAPITFIVSTWAYTRGLKLNYCVDCTFRNGTAAERGFLGNLFSQEGQYQVRLLMMLSLILTITVWIYYAVFYINVNLNVPDKFFFKWFPLLLFGLAIASLSIRYFSLWTYYCQDKEGSPVRNGSSTLLRYIVFCDDFVFLKKYDSEKDDAKAGEDKFDTPAKLSVPYRGQVMQYEVESFLKSLSGITECEVRLMYANKNFNADCNIFHYACFVDNKDIVAQSRLEGEWYTLQQINQMISNNLVAPIVVSEFSRMYRIIMAWKSYDRTGRRLYNIKNYKPTFRLKDLRDWDVDLNDTEWLYVSINNQDRPFYKLKRFWRKHINGIGN